MFAFNKNSDKLREEIILIGFQVRPKGIEFSPYPKTGDFYIQIHKMTRESLLVLVLSQIREVEERTVNLRKRQ